MQEEAKDYYIDYLHSSGERLGDLLDLPDEQLVKWFRRVRDKNRKRQAEMEKRSRELQQRQRQMQSRRR